MKRLLAIICVLLIIFIGMYIYKNNQNQNTVTVLEVEEIEEYITKIYMWQEITEEPLPNFDNINDAPELWIWEVVKKNLEEFELDYNQIQEKAIEIFGENFKKQFPKEGSEYIYYNEEIGRYIATGMGLDPIEDCFIINKINKKKDKYEIEIVEYAEDYENAMGELEEDEVYDVFIRNLNDEMIATRKSNESETTVINIVKENIDKFSKKTINLVKDKKGKIFIESVK